MATLIETPSGGALTLPVNLGPGLFQIDANGRVTISPNASGSQLTVNPNNGPAGSFTVGSDGAEGGRATCSGGYGYGFPFFGAYDDATGVSLVWWLEPEGWEALLALAAPPDSRIAANQVFNYYVATNGAAKFVRRGKTADGTVVQNVSPMAPPITSGVLPTVALVSATGAQVALNRDARLHVPVTMNPTAGAAATCKIELSPDNVTYSTLCTETVPLGVTFDGTIRDVSLIVPAGWYVKLTVTNATLGTGTYY